VASTTLTEPLEWQNSLLQGDVAEAVAALKRKDGADLHLIRSTKLVHTLIEHDLVDEFRVMIDPLVVGGGKRMFREDGALRPLRQPDDDDRRDPRDLRSGLGLTSPDSRPAAASRRGRRPMNSRRHSRLTGQMRPQPTTVTRKDDTMQKITPCLWFDTEGEEAARFYTSVFPNSRIVDIARYGSAGPRPEGTVMTVSFELDGQTAVALNGGPDFTFNESISFLVSCKEQDEVDTYWAKLSEGGEEGPCGWLKDKFGVSWQIVPDRLPELLSDPDREKSQRVMTAMLSMKKIEIDTLERAAREEVPAA
jgi:predicted 3-demethylubiquinone-9 3-methyltransferase (glyoxalase superfamily)